jgi:uncharacterized repeat protein (TIGR03803 family)
MNIHIKKLFLLPALIVGLGLILPGQVSAQTFTNLHNFTFGSDGTSPQGNLVLSGNILYGTTQSGGANFGAGTIFSIHTDGTGYTNFYSFDFAGPDGGHPNGSGGGTPYGGLILSGNTLYGTTSEGSSDNGTVFAVSTNGTGYTNLYRFTVATNGSAPRAGLVLSGNTLYGTTYQGGSAGDGTVFRVNTDGTDFTNLHSFSFNIDGGDLQAGLVLSGKILYGTTFAGGGAGNGTVFAINTDGTGFTNLYNFTGINDGSEPQATLILSGTNLYGTTLGGGSAGNGTVFAVSTNGTGYTNLYSFSAGDGPPNDEDNLTNSDGANPQASLILLGNTLYGTANQGGLGGVGTVFAVNTDSTGFTNLYNFTEPDPDTFTNTDGGVPLAGLILSGSTLYGTASVDGAANDGAVFGLSVTLPAAPLLAITLSGTNVVLTWSTNAGVFNLESTTNLVPPAAWSTVSPTQVVVSGQNAVTNPISGTRKFYRLSL